MSRDLVSKDECVELTEEEASSFKRKAENILRNKAPVAAQRIVDMMEFGEKDETRLKASNDVLKYAGVGADRNAPAVNINFPPEYLGKVLQGLASMFGEGERNVTESRSSRAGDTVEEVHRGPTSGQVE
ncbi:MAG: hypothetical protein ABID54_14290 [Pseudomonadota bacterium]